MHFKVPSIAPLTGGGGGDVCPDAGGVRADELQGTGGEWQPAEAAAGEGMHWAVGRCVHVRACVHALA